MVRVLLNAGCAWEKFLECSIDETGRSKKESNV